MRSVITIGVDAKGRQTIIQGPEATEKAQRAAFNAAKIGALPKGFVRLEVYERTRQTTGIDLVAQKARLDADGASKAKAEES